jgi:hypothetical protein
VYSQTIGALYHTVELNGAAQCCTTLDMLHQHPGIARHVQKLVVRQGGCPDPRTVRSPVIRGFSYADPSHVCAAVKRVAARLDALQSFTWGGEDYPWDDDVWLVLRQSYVPLPSFPSRVLNVCPVAMVIPLLVRCPQLKSIGVGFGALLPGVRSHVGPPSPRFSHQT